MVDSREPIPENAYQEQVAAEVARRLPWAVALFAAAFVAAGVFEYRAHPQRLGVYSVLFAAEMAVAGMAVACAQALWLPAVWRLRIVSAAGAVLAALIAIYHIWVRGEAEVLALALTYLVVGVMVLLPWGARGQVPVALVAVLGYAGAVASGVHVVTPVEIGFIGVLFTGALTVAGAAFLDHSRREAYRRTAELRREMAERYRAEEALAEQAEIQAALASVGRELITALNTPRLVETLGRATAEALGCDLSHTLLYRSEEDVFVCAAGWGSTPEELEAARAVRIPRQVMAGLLDKLRERSVAVVRTVPEELLSTRDRGTVSPGRFLCIALRRGEEVVGVQVAARRDGQVQISPRHERVGEGISQMASVVLENARLMEAVERASRLKSEFMATMSHELRTPLNVIIGYVQLLLEGAFGELHPGQRESLQRVAANARELLDLIDATLDFSRLESGRVEVVLEPVDLTGLADELAEETRDASRKPGVALHWEVEPGRRFWTDRVKLKVIVKNLLQNALKFTERGEVRVGMRPVGETLVVEVRDTGIGIEPAARERIFDAFQQGGEQVAQRYGGVGLGLFIVRQLVEILGGSIEVESEPGQGTTFRVQVPAGEPVTREAKDTTARV